MERIGDEGEAARLGLIMLEESGDAPVVLGMTRESEDALVDVQAAGVEGTWRSDEVISRNDDVDEDADDDEAEANEEAFTASAARAAA